MTERERDKLLIAIARQSQSGYEVFCKVRVWLCVLHNTHITVSEFAKVMPLL